MGQLINPKEEPFVRRSRRDAIQRLMEIAEAQQGYFTAQQAREAGFTHQSQSYHVRFGNWIREYRGIYRLAFYPLGERPELMLWYLWSHDREGNPEGVYSHETALSIHNLSDLLPSRLHMTVPPTVNRTGGPQNLVLHRGMLPEEDVEYSNGVRVTRPIRTIMDLLSEETVAWDVLRQSLRQALKNGLITRSDLLHTAESREWGHVLPKLYRLVLEVSTWQ